LLAGTSGKDQVGHQQIDGAIALLVDLHGSLAFSAGRTSKPRGRECCACLAHERLVLYQKDGAGRAMVWANGLAESHDVSGCSDTLHCIAGLGDVGEMGVLHLGIVFAVVLLG